MKHCGSQEICYLLSAHRTFQKFYVIIKLVTFCVCKFEVMRNVFFRFHSIDLLFTEARTNGVLTEVSKLALYLICENMLLFYVLGEVKQ